MNLPCRVKTYKFAIFGSSFGVMLILAFCAIYKTGMEHQGYLSHKLNFYTNIFFTETSGSADRLSARQACAVEAAALHNNHSKIQVWMFTMKTVMDTFNLKRFYPNINYIYSNFDNFFKDTLLERWYHEGTWKESPYRVSHLSDAVRYILTSKFGGIYLDLDAVVLKPLHGLRNFVVKESMDFLCSGIFGLDTNHELILHCLNEFSESYNKDCFNCVGPALMTQSLKTLRNISHLREAKNSSNLIILPEQTGSPLPYSQWSFYFRKSKANYVISKIENSYFVHLYNKLSKNRKLLFGSGSAYERIVKLNCPIVYEHVLRTSKTM